MKTKFTIRCNRCNSSECGIVQMSPPYWDDGYRLQCILCGLQTASDYVHEPLEEPLEWKPE